MLKARHSRVPWGVAIGFSIAPLVMGLFMVILKDPERARSLGLLGAKAQLTAGTADWPTFLNMLGQAVAVGGAILFAFLTAWVFGREFADRTVRGLLANPTPRRTIVLAKACVVAIWGLAISAWVLALGLAIGALVGLPGWSDVRRRRDRGGDRARRRPDHRAPDRRGVLRRRRTRLHRAAGVDRRDDRRVAGPDGAGLGCVVPVVRPGAPRRGGRNVGRAGHPGGGRGRPRRRGGRSGGDGRVVGSRRSDRLRARHGRRSLTATGWWSSKSVEALLGELSEEKGTSADHDGQMVTESAT